MINVSIIMPSLNVVQYIETALKSVVNQTLENIEIICVDAFSDDGTWDVLQKYAKNDERIILVKTSKRSYGYQVNIGINMARGRYIAILETDDYVDCNMYEKLYNTAIANDCEIVKADYKAFWTQKNGEKYFLRKRNLHDSKIYNKNLNPRKYTFLGDDDWYLWTGIYSKDFLNKYNIKLTESNGAAFQDIGFMVKTLQNAKNVMFVEDTFYNYCIDRQESSSNSGKGLIYSYNEFSKLSSYQFLYEKDSVNKLLYARMAKSFVICTDNIFGFINQNQEKIYNWFVDKLKYGIRQGYISNENLNEAIMKKLNRRIKDGGAFIKDRKKQHEEMEVYMKNKDIKVVIFGCGMKGYEAYRWCEYNNVTICGFMDNNSKLWSTKIDDYLVYAPVMAKGFDKKTVFLIANENNACDIKKQLKEMVFEESRIYFYV